MVTPDKLVSHGERVYLLIELQGNDQIQRVFLQVQGDISLVKRIEVCNG